MLAGFLMGAFAAVAAAGFVFFPFVLAASGAFFLAAALAAFAAAGFASALVVLATVFAALHLATGFGLLRSVHRGGEAQHEHQRHQDCVDLFHVSSP
jgi:hypothetical protein